MVLNLKSLATISTAHEVRGLDGPDGFFRDVVPHTAQNVSIDSLQLLQPVREEEWVGGGHGSGCRQYGVKCI